MLPVPAADLGEQVDELVAAGGQPVVGAVAVLVVLDELLFGQDLQVVRERTAMDCTRTRFRHPVQKHRVTQRTLVEGAQDDEGQFSFGQQIKELEDLVGVVSQRSSPPPNPCAARREA
jgi:hypothetical protein